MATFYNGTTGEFWYQGQKVAKVKNWNLEIRRETLDVTGLGDIDSSYVLAGRSASGSATVLYDSTDGATVSLFQSLLSNSTTTVQLKLVIGAGKQFEFDAVIPSLSTGSAINEVVNAQIQFSACGAVTGSL